MLCECCILVVVVVDDEDDDGSAKMTGLLQRGHEEWEWNHMSMHSVWKL